MTQAKKEDLQAEAPAVEVGPDATVVAQDDEYKTAAIPTEQRVKDEIESGSAFKSALREFVKSVKNTMEYARICAELSILHFEQHGDLVYAQAFLDAMPKNFVRRTAFKLWLKEFSPVTMTNEKFKKDKGENAVPFNTEAALATPFWDFAPDKEQVLWGETDIVKALKSAIHRFGSENYTPKDAKATAKLEAAEAAIAKLA